MHLKSGTIIDFGRAGNYRLFLPRGFSPAEDMETMTWTAQSVAEIQFVALESHVDLLLSCTVEPFLHERHSVFQEAHVFVNGSFVTYQRIYGHASFLIEIPRGRLSAQGNVLTFVLPKAISPARYGLGDDRRDLSLAFTRIAVGGR